MGMRDVVDNAVRQIQSLLGGLADAAKGAWDFITSSFEDLKSSIVEGAEDLYETLVGGSVWTDMMQEMISETDRGLERISRSFQELTPQIAVTVDEAAVKAGAALKELRLPAPTVGIAGALGGAVGPSVNLQINAPLVNIEGSADERTAELAAELAAEKVRDALRNVLVEASSSGAPVTHKRVRVGGLLNVA
jgi:hypothetical protein